MNNRLFIIFLPN